MTTPAKKKAPNVAGNWIEWLEKVDALHRERAGITGLSEVREKVAQAQHFIRYLCDKAWNSAHLPGNLDKDALQGGEGAQNVRAVVRGEEDGESLEAARYLLALTNRAQRSQDWRNQAPERRAFIESLGKELAEGARTLEEARVTLGEIEERRAEVDKRIEDLEEKAPKVSASALANVRAEHEAAAAERDRLQHALNGMNGEESALSLTSVAEREAGDRLDEAEALLAMGEGDPEEVKTAKAEADKARKALEAAKAEQHRQSAARRGLARKLEEAEARSETLARAYRQALGKLRHADLADEESKLMAQVEALSDHLAALARVYGDLEEAEPGHVYGPARIELTMPALYHHARRDEVQGPVTLTASGMGE